MCPRFLEHLVFRNRFDGVISGVFHIIRWTCTHIADHMQTDRQKFDVIGFHALEKQFLCNADQIVCVNSHKFARN